MRHVRPPGGPVGRACSREGEALSLLAAASLLPSYSAVPITGRLRGILMLDAFEKLRPASGAMRASSLLQVYLDTG